MSTSGEDHLYVRFKGRVLGPFESSRVDELVKRGQITRLHEISSDGLSWDTAEAFGLFVPSAESRNSRPQPNSQESTATPAAEGGPRRRDDAAAENTVEWYAHIDGGNRGPMRRSELEQLYERGGISANTLLWRPGLDNWGAAAQLIPDLFSIDSPANGRQAPQMDTGGVTSSSSSPGSGSDIYYQLGGQRFWALFLAYLLIGLGALGVIFWVVYMIVGVAPARALPLSGSFKVITGLEGLTASILVIVAGCLLARFGLALKDMAIRRNEADLVTAVQRLSIFWRFVGIVSLSMLLLFAISIAVFVAMAAGAGAGAAG